jgi:hypothetical protein
MSDKQVSAWALMCFVPILLCVILLPIYAVTGSHVIEGFMLIFWIICAASFLGPIVYMFAKDLLR